MFESISERTVTYDKQESLANAKVSARQRYMAKKSTENQRMEHNVEKYIQWVTTPSQTVGLSSFV